MKKSHQKRPPLLPLTTYYATASTNRIYSNEIECKQKLQTYWWTETSKARVNFIVKLSAGFSIYLSFFPIFRSLVGIAFGAHSLRVRAHFPTCLNDHFIISIFIFSLVLARRSSAAEVVSVSRLSCWNWIDVKWQLYLKRWI